MVHQKHSLVIFFSLCVCLSHIISTQNGFVHRNGKERNWVPQLFCYIVKVEYNCVGNSITTFANLNQL